MVKAFLTPAISSLPIHVARAKDPAHMAGDTPRSQGEALGCVVNSFIQPGLDHEDGLLAAMNNVEIRRLER